MGCKPWNNKFLEEVGNGILSQQNQCIVEGEPDAAVFRRIVEIRDASGAEAAQHTGVVWLPVPIVALADEGIGNRIEHSRTGTSVPSVKIPRILPENCRQNGARDKYIRRRICERSAVTFSIPLRALTIFRECILRLLTAGNRSDERKVNGIDGRFPCELEFLLGIERSSVGNVTHIEVWNESKHALLLFDLELLLRDFSNLYTREPHLHGGGSRGNIQNDRRNCVILSRLKLACKRLWRKAAGSNLEMKATGNNVGKEEGSILPRGCLLLLGSAVV